MNRRLRKFVWIGASLMLLSRAPALAAFATLSGTVIDPGGAGIDGVQINFVDSCTGLLASALGNVTSFTGTFTATVNAGTYDLEFVPPAGSLFTAYRIRNFPVAGTATLGTVRLSFGITVAGRVTDAAGSGIGSVFVHFFPPGSNERVYTVRDKTDLSGNYSIVVPAGTYDVKFGPPLGTRYLGVVRPAVPLLLNSTLPSVALPAGLLVSGTVFDTAGSGRPVINVNVNAVDTLTGASIFLSHDRTDASGAYTVAVPPGTFQFEYKPERCAPYLAGQESTPTAVSADLALPRVSLPAGVLVKGKVTDTRGAPVFDVNTNWLLCDLSTVPPVCNQIFTFDDHTDASGNYSAVVLGQNNYNIDFAPPLGIRLAGLKLNVGLNNSSVQTLSTVQLRDAVLVTGATRLVDGAAAANIDLDFFVAGTTSKIYTPNDHTDAGGAFTVAVEPGSYDVRFEPPSTTTLAARRLPGIQAAADVSLGKVTMLQGYSVSGNVSFNDPALGRQPVVNADMDFFDYYTKEKIETLHDNTDAGGNYRVIVPARVYNVRVTPAAGEPLETGQLSGVSITTITSGLDFVLGGAALVSGRVRDSFSQGVGGVDLDFFHSGSGLPQAVSRDNTAYDGSGTFSVYVPPGTYDITFTPPAASGLAMARLNGVLVATDIDVGDLVLARALLPSITSISPASGPSTGGSAVTILGSAFQAGARLTLGGLELLNVQVLSTGQINATTPACPVGSSGAVVDLVVENVGAPPVALAGAFTCAPPAQSASLTVSRASPSVVLSWTSTGQSFYTVYRSTSPRLFGQAQVLAILGAGATTFVDVGADADGVDYFYRVE